MIQLCTLSIRTLNGFIDFDNTESDNGCAIKSILTEIVILMCVCVGGGGVGVGVERLCQSASAEEPLVKSVMSKKKKKVHVTILLFFDLDLSILQICQCALTSVCMECAPPL